MMPRKRAVIMPVMLYRIIMATAVVGDVSGRLLAELLDDEVADAGLVLVVVPFREMFDMLAFLLAAKACTRLLA